MGCLNENNCTFMCQKKLHIKIMQKIHNMLMVKQCDEKITRMTLNKNIY